MFESPSTDRSLTSYRLGVDIGGTFTDLVLLGSDGSDYPLKVPSTPPDFGRAVVDGVRTLLTRAGLRPQVLSQVLHGTTVATNAILEGRGARTALVTTTGFRDVLEIGRMRHPSLYDVGWVKPPPLVPRRRRFELNLRIDATGTVRTRPGDEDLKRLAHHLRRDSTESLAVCFLNSYANPEAEREVAAALHEFLPEVFLSVSVDILPEIKEYERSSTTVVNAYVQPLVDRYLHSLQRDLQAMEVSAPLFVMHSGGGLLSIDTARRKPVQLVESGPAAGVVATVALGVRCGLPNLIAFDMGGTTAKASLIEAGKPFEATEYEVGGGMNAHRGLTSGAGYTIRVPSIDIAEVGAGGGSICWVDEGSAPHVGPRSAGAEPGPACYGRGGVEPTLTDAGLLLGYLDPQSLAGGAQSMDREAALRAIRDRFAVPLGLDPLEAAYGANAIAVTAMSRAVRAVTSERGRDPRDFVLVAFGGAGPAYAVEMAREFGIQTVLVPVTPGLFSSVGLLVADVQYHDVFSYPHRERRAGSTPWAEGNEIDQAFLLMEGRMLAELERQGYDRDRVVLARAADLRYAGQSSELRVPVPAGLLDEDTLRAVRSEFDAEHHRTYGHSGPEQSVELVNLRIRATYPSGNDGVETIRPPPETPAPAEGMRQAYFGALHGTLATPVLRRVHLAEGQREGPLIVEDMDATTVVPPGARATLDTWGNIRIEVQP